MSKRLNEKAIEAAFEAFKAERSQKSVYADRDAFKIERDAFKKQMRKLIREHFDKDSLHNYCKKYIEEQTIHSSETIHQCDWVIASAYEFIEGVCDIVGYHKPQDDDWDDE